MPDCLTLKMETLNRNVDIENEINIKPKLNNVVDSEIKRILLPLNLMQVLLLSPRYQIKNNLINSNNFLNTFISFCGTVFFVTIYVHRLLEIAFDDNFTRYTPVNFLTFASNFDVTYKCLGFIMNLTTNFIYSKKTVLFVLYFQEVHRFLSNISVIKRFIIETWISVVSFFAFYIFMIIYSNSFFHKPPWNVVLYKIILATIDANLIYAIRLIALLTNKVKLWNNKLLMDLKNGSELQTGRMFEAYDHLMKCYKLIKNIFQLPILYSTTGAFCYGLINIQIVIEYSKIEFANKTHESPVLSILLLLCIVQIYALQIALSLQLNAFYEAVKYTQDSCEFVLASACSEDQKKLCKNIQRLHRVSFSKMTACGLFYIDVCHPLQMLSLLTHYTIVLLQFAFL